ncbi:MAG TPA: hypothetical protein VHW65_13275, partial [Gemmatimonadales bacterium]|nr:hypothetical protein [Gemmatimonadales bacterium]
MRVVAVPTHLDHLSIDQVAAALNPWPPDEHLLIDAHATEWASPAGFVGLLTVGQAIAELNLPKPKLTLPAGDGVASYWAKIGFMRHAETLFELHGKVPRRKTDDSSDQLVPVQAIRNAADVHVVVDRIREHAAQILPNELGLESSVVGGFGQSLSEACQNITEHAGTGGWVAAHIYVYRQRLSGRK